MNEQILTFGTEGHVNFGVSSLQNNYEQKHTLSVVVEEDKFCTHYNVKIYGADNLESVFPFFKVTETSFFRFEHGENDLGLKRSSNCIDLPFGQILGLKRSSNCIRVQKDGYISSFPDKKNNKIYGLEILNYNKQKLFEKNGGHNHKNLNVWFGPYEGEDVCGKWSTFETDEVDGQTKPLLNNTSTERFISTYFQEPKVMNKRTFNFYIMS